MGVSIADVQMSNSTKRYRQGEKQEDSAGSKSPEESLRRLATSEPSAQILAAESGSIRRSQRFASKTRADELVHGRYRFGLKTEIRDPALVPGQTLDP